MPDVVRAWKDEEYRLSLDEAERVQLPENPVGLVELPDGELEAVAGGTTWTTVSSVPCIESAISVASAIYSYARC
jgi:mersacidin/lichenicidin family type 2 lantibiotic